MVILFGSTTDGALLRDKLVKSSLHITMVYYTLAVTISEYCVIISMYIYFDDYYYY